MPGARVFWMLVNTNYPEGTLPAHHYTVHLGAMSADEPLLAVEHIFADVAPGDYPSSVETMAVDGTVLATRLGPVFHMPQPQVVAVATNVQVEMVP